jgi:non-heme chloroperoxidase
MLHCADDLEGVLDSLDRAPAIVGASLGGCMGLLVAGHRKRDVAALVLVDVAPNVEFAGVERIRTFMGARPEGFASLEEAADLVASYLPHRRRPKDLGGLRKNLRLDDDGRYRWHWDPAFLEVMFQAQPGTGEALLQASRSLEATPTLLIRGKMSDVLSESGARAFLEMAPHARYVDISDAGHMVAGDRNDHFTSAVTDFLRDVMPPA